ncbi:MAG: carbohydrate binding family 9 domain-containing protein [Prolixibacteraceae bacterium]|nr:carbohydrate binding family 9 domain-containing protein [Prolixibacteraceae bacterium]MBT6766119.1 carbohydrate binding family 9 domain-containing protein [Prolixibacteraceae bacterium]MBT7000799.1 carbohydrate binding family 9 domain-containing protein [Prolixibacteraceae bacterium]MBT7393564.1 carbohydrate binding family 9 domain-containing protein [Prolixibacteraceae bacterium]
MKRIIFSLAVFFFLIEIAFSQTVVNAVRIDTPPVIDGIVNEEIWNEAYVVSEFYQREPNEGEPITEKTEFLTCYDANFIYFAAKCWDDPEDITAKELARDVSLRYDDRIQIILDTYLDHRNGYWFQIGPRGSIGDALVSANGTSFNKEWDGLWTGKAKITDYGWEAEIRIPFKTMGFDKENTQWGIKFIRHVVKKLESGYWPEANLNTHRFQVSDAGILDGIENITQGIGLDISPYLVTGMDTKKGEDNNPKLTGGLDLFYQITPSLKSSLTINTDFAETEVDDRQINLMRFNLHYPEKRAFFLDGASYFQFGIEGDRTSPVASKIIPFFSRRMGLNEEGSPIPINYGAKLTGQVDNWNIGMMHINDDSEVGQNKYSVARVTRNLGQQSSIGLIGTYGNALDTLGDQSNLLTGVDLKLSTSTFQGNKNASFFLFGLKSNTNNIDGKDASWGAQVSYPNDLISARLGYHQIGENFHAGMGFVPRTNIKESYGELEFGPRPDKWGIMQIQFGGEFGYITNFETNALETREFKIKPLGIRFMSGEEISYSLVSQYELLSEDFNIFENYIIPQGKYEWWYQIIQLETKGARNIWGEATYGFGDFYNGYRKDIILKANWKVAVPLFIGTTVTRNNIELPEGNFTANIYQVNANILFSPDLTLYNYFQYDNASRSAGWQSRFQWILKPGNEIILAWTSNFIKPADAFFMDESAVRLKLKYNIRF